MQTSLLRKLVHFPGVFFFFSSCATTVFILLPKNKRLIFFISFFFYCLIDVFSSLNATSFFCCCCRDCRPPACGLNPPLPVPRIRMTRFSPSFSTMSYIHKVLNVLLRGLVIYAVLGLECTYSNDLPSHSSDAANVATTGKRSPCRIQVSPIYLRIQHYPPPPPPHPVFLFPMAFSGEAEEYPAQGL